MSKMYLPFTNFLYLNSHSYKDVYDISDKVILGPVSLCLRTIFYKDKDTSVLAITTFSPGLKMLRLLCLLMFVLAVNTYDLDKTDVENINEELSEIASVSLSGSPKNENMR